MGTDARQGHLSPKPGPLLDSFTVSQMALHTPPTQLDSNQEGANHLEGPRTGPASSG